MAARRYFKPYSTKQAYMAMALKNKKITQSSPRRRDDRQRLQAVARTLLRRLEEALKDAGDGDDPALLLRVHERLFGAKHSLVATLVTLAELLLSLEAPALNAAAGEGGMLSPGDVALVEDFVRKERARKEDNGQAGD